MLPAVAEVIAVDTLVGGGTEVIQQTDSGSQWPICLLVVRRHGDTANGCLAVAFG